MESFHFTKLRKAVEIVLIYQTLTNFYKIHKERTFQTKKLEKKKIKESMLQQYMQPPL